MSEKLTKECKQGMKGFTLATLLLAAVAAVAADTDENGYAVLIEQSPIHAGTINPGLGVHKMAVGATLTLTAMPKPGYRFLYWLGDVSDPASMATQVRVDAPKIVIAVYERDDFEIPLEVSRSFPAGAPQGGAVSTPLTVSGGNVGMMAYYPEIEYASYQWPDWPQEENDPFPVPGDETDQDFPVPDENPIPEPTTVCLLAAGAVLLRLKRKEG
jgi:hypothetical protein